MWVSNLRKLNYEKKNQKEIILSTSKGVFPSYQGETTIFDEGNFKS